MSNFYAKVKPVIDLRMRKICISPYLNHRKGCPNYNKRKDCPPKCKNIDKILDFNKDIYVIYNKYDFKKHVDKMREKHPEWSKRQLECCLYWQGTARKSLREKIKLFKIEYPNLFIAKCPEGSGTNLTETMKQININLEWPPKNYTYQIVLAGIKCNLNGDK